MNTKNIGISQKLIHTHPNGTVDVYLIKNGQDLHDASQEIIKKMVKLGEIVEPSHDADSGVVDAFNCAMEVVNNGRVFRTSSSGSRYEITMHEALMLQPNYGHSTYRAWVEKH